MLRTYLLILFFAALDFAARTVAAQPAATPPPTHQWQRAASLLPGSEILVRERGQPTPQACVLVWIDNAALACDAETQTGRHRVVYPAASVLSVVEAPSYSGDQDRPHVALPIIFAGVGALLGGLAARDAGTKAGFGGAMLGAAFGGGIAAGASNFSPPPRAPWSLHVPIGAHHMRLSRFPR